MELLTQKQSQSQTHETDSDKFKRLAADSATYQKVILLLEVLTDTAGLERGCGFAPLSHKMRELKESFDELGKIVGYNPDNTEQEE